MTDLPPTSALDPVRWAEAAAHLATNPAFYVFVGLLALLIVMKWGPWRRKGE